MADHAAALGAAIRSEFRRRMLDEYVPRIESCVTRLDGNQLWHRPNPQCNSVGNLLMHLAGNVRQWIQAGLGGQADARDRDGEFAADGTTTPTGAELLARLRATVEEATAIVDGLDVDALLATTLFQARYEETGVGAVLHVMEHFSGHAGQIYDRTKQLCAVDLAHYDL